MLITLFVPLWRLFQPWNTPQQQVRREGRKYSVALLRASGGTGQHSRRCGLCTGCARAQVHASRLYQTQVARIISRSHVRQSLAGAWSGFRQSLTPAPNSPSRVMGRRGDPTALMVHTFGLPAAICNKTNAKKTNAAYHCCISGRV